MTLQSPPIQQPMITDKDGYPTTQWAQFFDAIFRGDAGDTWLPTIANLTIVGGVPAAIGRVYRLSQYLSVFVATITPPANGNISGTAGTTGITNFPLKMSGNGVCFAVSGLLGTVSGMCDKNSNVIYPPGFTSVTVPLTIIGLVEAS